VTFPLTYYPLALAALLVGEAPAVRRERRALSGPDLAIGGLAALFAVAFLYQVVVSLGHDIGELAQRPAFAVGGRLGIPYLLASHFFEHVLDSLFFALMTLSLAWRRPFEGTGTETGADPASGSVLRTSP
jgi:hypothetical protein